MKSWTALIIAFALMQLACLTSSAASIELTAFDGTESIIDFGAPPEPVVVGNPWATNGVTFTVGDGSHQGVSVRDESARFDNIAGASLNGAFASGLATANVRIDLNAHVANKVGLLACSYDGIATFQLRAFRADNSLLGSVDKVLPANEEAVFLGLRFDEAIAYLELQRIASPTYAHSNLIDDFRHIDDRTGPIQWQVGDGGNGHWYELVTEGAAITWHDARAAASARCFMGMPGYLATITNAAENQFIIDNFAPASIERGLWLGANDAAVEGEWRWVTGPEAGTLFSSGNYPSVSVLTYADWGSNEPADYPPGEDYLVIDSEGGTGNTEWDDKPVDYAYSYLIEYGGPEVLLDSFPGNGALIWSDCATSGYHTVEWAASITGTWHHSWSSLINHNATGGTTAVNVPMFYRVIWTADQQTD